MALVFFQHTSWGDLKTIAVSISPLQAKVTVFLSVWQISPSNYSTWIGPEIDQHKWTLAQVKKLSGKKIPKGEELKGFFSCSCVINGVQCSRATEDLIVKITQYMFQAFSCIAHCLYRSRPQKMDNQFTVGLGQSTNKHCYTYSWRTHIHNTPVLNVGGLKIISLSPTEILEKLCIDEDSLKSHATSDPSSYRSNKNVSTLYSSNFYLWTLKSNPTLPSTLISTVSSQIHNLSMPQHNCTPWPNCELH